MLLGWLQLGSSAGVTVVLDCGGADADVDPQLLKHLTVISPNESELANLTGQHSLCDIPSCALTKQDAAWMTKRCVVAGAKQSRPSIYSGFSVEYHSLKAQLRTLTQHVTSCTPALRSPLPSHQGTYCEACELHSATYSLRGGYIAAVLELHFGFSMDLTLRQTQQKHVGTVAYRTFVCQKSQIACMHKAVGPVCPTCCCPCRHADRG